MRAFETYTCALLIIQMRAYERVLMSHGHFIDSSDSKSTQTNLALNTVPVLSKSTRHANKAENNVKRIQYRFKRISFQSFNRRFLWNKTFLLLYPCVQPSVPLTGKPWDVIYRTMEEIRFVLFFAWWALLVMRRLSKYCILQPKVPLADLQTCSTDKYIVWSSFTHF